MSEDESEYEPTEYEEVMAEQYGETEEVVSQAERRAAAAYERQLKGERPVAPKREPETAEMLRAAKARVKEMVTETALLDRPLTVTTASFGDARKVCLIRDHLVTVQEREKDKRDYYEEPQRDPEGKLLPPAKKGEASISRGGFTKSSERVELKKCLIFDSPIVKCLAKGDTVAEVKSQFPQASQACTKTLAAYKCAVSLTPTMAAGLAQTDPVDSRMCSLRLLNNGLITSDPAKTFNFPEVTPKGSKQESSEGKVMGEKVYRYLPPKIIVQKGKILGIKPKPEVYIDI